MSVRVSYIWDFENDLHIYKDLIENRYFAESHYYKSSIPKWLVVSLCLCLSNKTIKFEKTKRKKGVQDK